MTTAGGAGAASPMSARRRGAILLLGVVSVALFCGLGVWQLQRRVWKLTLIAHVEQRVHAPPSAAPGPGQWPSMTADNAEYRHVTLTGHYLPARDARVLAVTELGPGYWVLTPFQACDGFVVLVNRGYVPQDWSEPAAAATAGQGSGCGQRVTGLLRISEPHGGFLRANDPAQGRWYSRDVAAIGAWQGMTGQGVTGAAPYFIDAEADGGDGYPRGGLTVVKFPNSHLVYALTWFGMALTCILACAAALRAEPRREAEAPTAG